MPDENSDYQRWIFPCLISLLFHLVLAGTLTPARPTARAARIAGILSAELKKSSSTPRIAETKAPETNSTGNMVRKKERKPDRQARHQTASQNVRHSSGAGQEIATDSASNANSDIDTSAYRLQIALAARHLWPKSAMTTAPGFNGRSIVKISKSAGDTTPMVALHQSSGDEALDKSAVENIAAAARQVQTPNQLFLQSVTLLITVDFSKSQNPE